MRLVLAGPLFALTGVRLDLPAGSLSVLNMGTVGEDSRHTLLAMAPRQPPSRQPNITGIQLDADELSIQFEGNERGGATAGERIEYDATNRTPGFDRRLDEFRGYTAK